MFLLVPAHPGCPGQIPQSRKTVVCVCDSLFFTISLQVFFGLAPSTSYSIHLFTQFTTTITTVLWPPGLSRTTRMSRYQKGKSNLDLLKQKLVSASGISSAICKSAPCPRQITMPASHHSVFYRPDALSATQPTVSKH